LYYSLTVVEINLIFDLLLFAGHFRVPNLRVDGLALLLHRVRADLPQGPRLQAQANLADRLLRLLGEVQVQGHRWWTPGQTFTIVVDEKKVSKIFKLEHFLVIHYNILFSYYHLDKLVFK
jgi:hypothetical protein